MRASISRSVGAGWGGGGAAERRGVRCGNASGVGEECEGKKSDGGV